MKALAQILVGVVVSVLVVLGLLSISISVQAPPKYNINYELISNTDYCLVDCSLKFKFKIDNDYIIDSADKFKRVFKKVRGDVNILEHGFRLGTEETYNESKWIFNITCVSYNVTSANASVGTKQECTDNGYLHTEEKTRMVYESFNPLGKTIKADKWYYIELWGKRELGYGTDSVDAVPVLGGFEFPFSIWNSYHYRYEIYSNATSVMPINVNDTNIPGVWTLNASSADGEKKYLYCAVSVCSDGNWSIGNTTDETPWENESTRTGKNPTLVWDEQTAGGWHLGESSGDAIDSTRYGHDLTHVAAPTQADTGIFGKAVHYNYSLTQYSVTTAEMYDTGTMIAWFKQDAAETNNGVFGLSNSTWYGGGIGIAGETSAGNDWAYYWGGVTGFACASETEANSMIPGTWQHMAYTWNSTNGWVYINSQLNGSCVFSEALATGNMSLYIGNRGRPENYFNGVIDEVRYYNKTLSAAEIQEHYWNGINNLTSLGDEEETDADESQGDDAIVTGIQQSVLGSGATIYTDQQIYIRYTNTTQMLGTFDKVTKSGNQTWAFNYITTGESRNNMSSLGITINIWENESLTATVITSQVESLINSTKI